MLLARIDDHTMETERRIYVVSRPFNAAKYYEINDGKYFSTDLLAAFFGTLPENWQQVLDDEVKHLVFMESRGTGYHYE
jgi:hypothetical protein